MEFKIYGFFWSFHENTFFNEKNEIQVLFGKGLVIHVDPFDSCVHSQIFTLEVKNSALDAEFFTLDSSENNIPGDIVRTYSSHSVTSLLSISRIVKQFCPQLSE